MAVTNFSPLLGLALPTTGDLSGTWGTAVNDQITQLLDSAVAGTTTLSADADVTLSTTNGADNQARNAVILWTASNGANTRNITAPAQSKAYVVINAGTGPIVIRGAGPTTGVTLPAGTRALVAWNGSDFVKVASNPAVLTTDVSGTLPVANGGTGAAALTANNVIIGNGTSAVNFVAPGTSGNILASNGTTWTSAPLPAGGLTYIFTTTSVTAVDKQGVLTDTSGGAFTVTLPATPSTGAQVVVADAGGVWGTNNLTVARNGSTIGDLAENLTCDINGASVQLVYDGTTWEVYAQIGGNGGTAVTLAGVQTLTNKTINIANNTLTGVQPTLVSGTNIKTIGGVSVLGSGDLAVSSGALTLISVTTVSSSVAQVDITSGFSSTYDDYLFIVENVVGPLKLAMRVQKSAAFQTSGYNLARAANASFAGENNNSRWTFISQNGMLNTNRTYGTIYLLNVNDTTGRTACSAQAGCMSNTSTNALTTFIGEQTTAAALTGVRFLDEDAENFTAGTFRLYGIQKS